MLRRRHGCFLGKADQTGAIVGEHPTSMARRGATNSDENETIGQTVGGASAGAFSWGRRDLRSRFLFFCFFVFFLILCCFLFLLCTAASSF
jgi:hypothetical protein